MKAKVLTRINALLALLLSVLGFNGCFPRVKYGVDPNPGPIAEYGCPYAQFEATGVVTDEENQPMENVQVIVKNKGDNDTPREFLPTVYTDDAGVYRYSNEYMFPTDSMDVIVMDTAGVYESDSVRVKVDYDRSGVAPEDHWNAGVGIVYQDFQLKKK